MDRYFTAKGNLYHIKVYEDLTRRYVLNLPDGTSGLFSEKDWAIIITGYTLKEIEITAKASCINDKRVMYSFGKGFGDMTVNCEALLGADPNKCHFEKWIKEEYEKARLNSAKGKPAVLSSHQGGALEFHITGLQVGGYIPELEVLPFAWIGTLNK